MSSQITSHNVPELYGQPKPSTPRLNNTATLSIEFYVYKLISLQVYKSIKGLLIRWLSSIRNGMADSCSQATPYWIYVCQETKHLSCRRDKTWVQHIIILRIILRLHTLRMVLPPVYPKNCEPNICCTGEHSASQATPLLHELCCRSDAVLFRKKSWLSWNGCMNVVGCGCLQKFMVSYFYVGNRGGNVWKNAGLHILLLSRLFTCFVWATSASRYVHTARIRNFLTNFQFLT